jgi:general secretion pathway protein L
MISVGIDIGRASVKVAEVESLPRSFVVKRFLEFPLSIDANKDKKIEIIDILRQIIPQYNIDQTKFVFCVRQEDVSLRLKRFPFRERHKILRTVPFEVEDEIPFSQADAIFEAKTVRFDGKFAEVLAMACPKERIRDVVQLAHDGGVHPSLVSLETLALSNLLEAWENPPPETAPIAPEAGAERSGELLVDIGDVSTKCIFYENGSMVAVRHIDWGGRNIVTQIAQKYGLTLLQATKELETKSAILVDKTKATKEQAAFSKVIETATLDLTRELRLKLLEVKGDNHLNIIKAHMTGGPTLIKGFGAFLTQNLEVPFNRLKILSLLQNVTFEADAHEESVAGVAIGLAIEGLKRPRNPAIDFLKDDFANQSNRFERLWEKWGFTAQLALAAFVIFFGYAVVRDSLSSSASDKSNEILKNQAGAIANMKGNSASPSKIRKFLSEHDKIEKSRKQAEKVLRINSALDVLNLITQSLPDVIVTTDIKHLQIESDMAEIQGYLVNGTTPAAVQKALGAAALGGKVEPMTPSLPPQSGKTPFGFKFKVTRMEGGQ